MPASIICMGGCRARAFIEYGNFEAPNPLCQSFYNNSLFPKKSLRVKIISKIKATKITFLKILPISFFGLFLPAASGGHWISGIFDKVDYIGPLLKNNPLRGCF